MAKEHNIKVEAVLMHQASVLSELGPSSYCCELHWT
jgi:DNA-directed RNA polymerase subunit N (RpoN/RPB10)